jgi:hypothetical protein
MARTSIGLTIHGALNAKESVIRFRETTGQRITQVLQAELPFAEEGMRNAMRLAYTDGSGQAGESIRGEVTAEGNNARVSISIANFREVKYLTRLVPDSDFRAEPYVITAHKERMVFYWKKLGRVVALKQVTHPGFGRKGDVLADSGAAAMSNLGWAVEREVRSAVAEVTAGGRTFRVSGRRVRG